MSLPDYWWVPGGGGLIHVVAGGEGQMLRNLQAADLKAELQGDGLTEEVPPRRYRIIKTDPAQAREVRGLIKEAGWRPGPAPSRRDRPTRA